MCSMCALGCHTRRNVYHAGAAVGWMDKVLLNLLARHARILWVAQAL